MSLQARMERIMTSLCESVSDLRHELGEWSTPCLHVGVCTLIIFPAINLSLSIWSWITRYAPNLPGNILEASSFLVQEGYDPWDISDSR